MSTPPASIAKIFYQASELEDLRGALEALESLSTQAALHPGEFFPPTLRLLLYRVKLAIRDAECRAKFSSTVHLLESACDGVVINFGDLMNETYNKPPFVPFHVPPGETRLHVYLWSPVASEYLPCTEPHFGLNSFRTLEELHTSVGAWLDSLSTKDFKHTPRFCIKDTAGRMIDEYPSQPIIRES